MLLAKHVPLEVKRKYWALRERVRDGKPVFGRLTDGLNARKNLKGRFCPRPWQSFEIGGNGDVHVCCSSWLTKPIGNYLENTMSEIWNSKAAQSIRKSILDGSFRYCNQDVCWPIQKDALAATKDLTGEYRQIVDRKVTVLDRPPEEFGLQYDRSCNLSCPSCRQELVYFKEGPEYERSLAIHTRLMRDIFSKPHRDRFRVLCTGTGDPFASPVYRDFLFNLNGADFPNVVINLTTNGILFTRANWQRMAGVRNNLGAVIVSFDAATPETYAITRRGGNFDVLVNNLGLLSELRRDGYIKSLKMDFVVQHTNYREMPDFVRLAKSFGHVDSVGFALITNWGTFSPTEFKHHAIWRSDHPELSDFLQVLRDPVLDDPIVDLKNLAGYRELARKSH